MNLTLTLDFDDLTEAITDYVKKRLTDTHPGMNVCIEEIVLEDSDGDETDFEQVRVVLE